MNKEGTTTVAEAIQPTLRAGHEFEVIVIFTSVRPTLQALKRAGRLAKGLGGRIRLIVPSITLNSGSSKHHLASGASLELPLHTIVGNSKIETRIDVRVCRNRWEMLQTVLAPESLIVMAERSRWWPTAEDRLARCLRAAGHHVLISSREE
jgi:hypothetical protein